MPVSKKPRRKAAPAPARRTAAASVALPDRRTIESFLAELGDSRDDAVSAAQQVMYEAWDATGSRARIALARKALAISPLCADAYNLLAEETASPQQKHDLYARGVEAGERALGPEGFEEYAGHFWGFLETRPYMRARAGLANTLLRLGDEDAAIGHFRAMLDLNPNDNQGVRYTLLACLLRRDDWDAVKQLLAAFDEEGSAFWYYTRALVAFRDGQGSEAATLELLRTGWRRNHHIPAMLAAAKAPRQSNNPFTVMGGADEAATYVRDCGAAWRGTDGAVAWLTQQVAGWPKPERPGRPTG